MTTLLLAALLVLPAQRARPLDERLRARRARRNALAVAHLLGQQRAGARVAAVAAPAADAGALRLVLRDVVALHEPLAVAVARPGVAGRAPLLEERERLRAVLRHGLAAPV